MLKGLSRRSSVHRTVAIIICVSFHIAQTTTTSGQHLEAVCYRAAEAYES